MCLCNSLLCKRSFLILGTEIIIQGEPAKQIENRILNQKIQNWSECDSKVYNVLKFELKNLQPVSFGKKTFSFYSDSEKMFENKNQTFKKITFLKIRI